MRYSIHKTNYPVPISISSLNTSFILQQQVSNCNGTSHGIPMQCSLLAKVRGIHITAML